MSAHADFYDDLDEPFDDNDGPSDPDDERSWCASSDEELDINEMIECERCIGLDRCVDDICHGAGRCMH